MDVIRQLKARLLPCRRIHSELDVICVWSLTRCRRIGAMQILQWNRKMQKLLGLAPISGPIYKILPYFVLSTQLVIISPVLFYIIANWSDKREVIRMTYDIIHSMTAIGMHIIIWRNVEEVSVLIESLQALANKSKFPAHPSY